MFLGLKFGGAGDRPVDRQRHDRWVSKVVNATARLLIGRKRVVAILFYLPNVVAVGLLGRSRKQADLPSPCPMRFDLMVVCVEAGLGLDQAMRKVSDEMRHSYRILSDEFASTNFQLQMGRSRAEALHELGARTGVSDLRALAAVLIQADKFGSSIAQALRVQSESMRTRRRQLAEEKAAKTAVKLIFPLILFIFPGIFVILVGPAAITMIREMFPKMNGGGLTIDETTSRGLSQCSFDEDGTVPFGNPVIPSPVPTILAPR